MNNKMIIKTFCLSLLILPIAACGDDETTPSADAAGTIDAAGPDAGPPAKPTLGAQIDRAGRPAINTALNKTFTADATRNVAEDAWNGNASPATWGAMHGADVAATLAILDALDGNCGNQLLAAAPPVTAARYAGLAGVLTIDMLQVDAAKTTCGAYLAVEANATGTAPNTQCGGRKLEFDVIATSYSVLAAGALSGVDDNIDFTATVTTTFPYLGPPTN